MPPMCGQTHEAGEARILPKLRELTGGGSTGKPCVQRVIEVV
ncbi:hypothetical protein ACYOEI_10105 [Singulisphaera rosea]